MTVDRGINRDAITNIPQINGVPHCKMAGVWRHARENSHMLMISPVHAGSQSVRTRLFWPRVGGNDQLLPPFVAKSANM
jgi:hypothetical protein